MGEELCVAGKIVTPKPDRILAYRGRNDSVDLAGPPKLDRSYDIFGCCLTGYCRINTKIDIGRLIPKIFDRN